MIAPIMDYGDIIYAGTNCENLDKLHKLQNRGLQQIIAAALAVDNSL